jgi:hypothetical protein
MDRCFIMVIEKTLSCFIHHAGREKINEATGK